MIKRKVKRSFGDNMFILGKRSRKNMIGLHPQIAFFIEETIKESKQDFGILNKGGVRTNQEQADMYAQGRIEEGSKITWTLDSYHQYGLAGDLVAYNSGRFNWDEKNYAEIIRAAKVVIKKYNLDIESGYELWGKDMPHFQMTGYKPYYDIRKYV